MVYDASVEELKKKKLELERDLSIILNSHVVIESIDSVDGDVPVPASRKRRAVTNSR